MASFGGGSNSQIVYLNVGGTSFCTSRETLTSVQDSFFTALLCGDIDSQRDDSGALFIDRDPKLFRIILNYMRSRDLDVTGVSVESLWHEAQYYGLTSLASKLALCTQLDTPACGGLLFHGHLPPPPVPPVVCVCQSPSSSSRGRGRGRDGASHTLRHCVSCSTTDYRGRHLRFFDAAGATGGAATGGGVRRSISLKTANDRCMIHGVPSVRPPSRPPSRPFGSNDYDDVTSTDMSGSVRLICCHQGWIVVGYQRFIVGYSVRDSHGWRLLFTSPLLAADVDLVAVNAKSSATATATSSAATTRMVAVAYGGGADGAAVGSILLWSVSDNGTLRTVGEFSLAAPVEQLFFIGAHLVALSSGGGGCGGGGGGCGRMGVWHAAAQNWRCQDIVPIASNQMADTVLLLGGVDGSIYYIDMQKFPLRIKDNDLLVTELYRDANSEPITAITVYLILKTKNSGNWIEIAYGTACGTVCIIVEHPETVGGGPQLFQTFTVHCSAITRVSLSERYLISMCSELGHVRSWSVARFRGRISTQPGSLALASFKVISLNSTTTTTAAAGGAECSTGAAAAAADADNDEPEFDSKAARWRFAMQPSFNSPGPYGDQDGELVFVQQLVQQQLQQRQLFVRLAADGRRVCTISSIDHTGITAFTVHEYESFSRMTIRPRRYLITGHSDGSLQIWDLSTALERCNAPSSSSSAAATTPAAAAAAAASQSSGTLACSSSPYSTTAGANTGYSTAAAASLGDWCGGVGAGVAAPYGPLSGGPTAVELLKQLESQQLGEYMADTDYGTVSGRRSVRAGGSGRRRGAGGTCDGGGGSRGGGGCSARGGFAAYGGGGSGGNVKGYGCGGSGGGGCGNGSGRGVDSRDVGGSRCACDCGAAAAAAAAATGGGGGGGNRGSSSSPLPSAGRRRDGGSGGGGRSSSPAPCLSPVAR